MLPLLESYATTSIPEITSLDASYKACKAQAQKELAESLIGMMNRKATKFPNVSVDSSEAPIVVPE